MEYIKCSHPDGHVRPKVELEPSLDGIIKHLTPRPYCDLCDCFLPVNESPGREIVRFWFLRQDNIVRAIPST